MRCCARVPASPAGAASRTRSRNGKRVGLRMATGAQLPLWSDLEINSFSIRLATGTFESSGPRNSEGDDVSKMRLSRNCLRFVTVRSL